MLSEALRNRLAEVRPGDPDHRTWAEAIAANLIEIAASKSSNAIAAANEIADRTQGRAPQQIDVNDISRDLRERSDADLMFYLEHMRWPEDSEAEAEAPARKG